MFRRRLFAMLCFVFVVFCTSASSFAEGAGGKAYIPTYWSGTNLFSGILFANITENPVDIYITVYTSTGTIWKDNGYDMITPSSTLSNFSDNPTGDYSVVATLAAHASGYVDLRNISNFGYAVLEWAQSDSAQSVALVAHSKIAVSENYFSVPVNNGLPF